MIQEIHHDTTLPKIVQIPTSKSYFQRIIIAATLSKSFTEIEYNSLSDDVAYLLEAIQILGVKVEKVSESKMVITPPVNGFPKEAIIQIGESGLGSRLIIPVLAAIGGEFTINGKGSLLSRPFAPVIDVLEKAGVEVVSNNGKLPITIKGKLKAGQFEIPADLSSQFASGFLMALPLLNKDCSISLTNPKSVPYLEMTLQVLQDFGVNYKSKKDFSWSLSRENTFRSPKKITVEGDWSGASFWIVAATIFSNIRLSGLEKNSLQADAAILEVLDQIFAKYHWEGSDLIIKKSDLTPFAFDATDCPDLFPPLAVLAACTEGESCIKGVNRLVHKESNRALAIQEELAKMNIQVTITGDIMCIEGKKKCQSAKVHSHNDHRMAMALAILALNAEGKTTIENAEAISKSYPDFWKELLG